MTVYALDLAQVQQTIRDTLVSKVLPAVGSESARQELHAVIEMLDNLESRLTWDRAALSEAVAESHALGVALGVDTGAPRQPLDDVEALHNSRLSIGQALESLYTNGVDSAMVESVADFTARDVLTEISVALRLGLPDQGDSQDCSLA